MSMSRRYLKALEEEIGQLADATYFAEEEASTEEFFEASKSIELINKVIRKYYKE